MECLCSEELDEIGCEKTITCPNCGRTLKYNYGEHGDRSFEEVKENDSIYWDR